MKENNKKRVFRPENERKVKRRNQSGGFIRMDASPVYTLPQSIDHARQMAKEIHRDMTDGLE